MIPEPDWTAELEDLLERLIDGEFDTADRTRLNVLLAQGEAPRRYYRGYMRLHHGLEWRIGEPALRQDICPPQDRNRGQRRGVDGCPAIELPHQLDPESQISNPPFPSLSTTHYPLPTTFIGGPVFSYMVATVILGVMLLGAWVHTITHFQPQVVRTPLPTAPSDARPELVFVGRISGMKDCRWSDPQTEAYVGASVPLNRRYALASGLMEITYKTGAKVILEGPCTYEVESHTGGYLSLGKLMAKVESAKPQAANHNPPSPLSPLPSPLFSVRTPTAVITDLGTEFGVEVGENGTTESHVIQGKVDVRILVSDNGDENHVSVAEGNAIRVEADGKTFSVVPYASDHFVRRLAVPPDTRAEESYIQAVLADKPLGYWPLNESAYARKFRDLSGNKFHGAAMGNVSAGSPGPLPGQSHAVELKGDGYIDIGRRDEFALENGFTFEAWVFLDDDCWTEDSLTHIRVISATSSDGRYQESGWSVGFKPFAVGKQPFCCFGPHGYQIGSTALRDADVPVSRWVHVALVYDSDNVATLYLNGKRRASALDGRPVKIGPTWVTIGFGAPLSNEYWRGRLAHVAVYPTTLSGQQIFNHYKYFEKSAGGNVTDSSATTQENERR